MHFYPQPNAMPVMDAHDHGLLLEPESEPLKRTSTRYVHHVEVFMFHRGSICVLAWVGSWHRLIFALAASPPSLSPKKSSFTNGDVLFIAAFGRRRDRVLSSEGFK